MWSVGVDTIEDTGCDSGANSHFRTHLKPSGATYGGPMDLTMSDDGTSLITGVDEPATSLSIGVSRGVGRTVRFGVVLATAVAVGVVAAVTVAVAVVRVGNAGVSAVISSKSIDLKK